MSIEVKQMTIKSNIVNGQANTKSQDQSSVDIDKLTESLTEICKELIKERLSELQER